jgi:hypothetical protein
MCQHRPLPEPAQVDGRAADLGPHRPEHREPHLALRSRQARADAVSAADAVTGGHGI